MFDMSTDGTHLTLSQLVINIGCKSVQSTRARGGCSFCYGIVDYHCLNIICFL